MYEMWFFGIGYAAEGLLWMWGILQMRFVREKWKFAVAGTFYLAALIFQMMLGMEEYGVLLYMACALVLSPFIFQGRFLEIELRFFFRFFSAYVIGNPIHFLFFILKQEFAGLSFLKYNRILEEIVILAAELALICLVQKHEKWKVVMREAPNSYYILGIVLSICGSGVTNWILGLDMQESESFQIAFQTLVICFGECICFLWIVLVVVNDLRRRYQRESDQKSVYLGYSRKYYESLQKQMVETRKIKHDVKKHFAVVERYLEKEQWQKAKEYLRQIGGRLTSDLCMSVNVGNDLVNAVIFNEQNRFSSEIVLFCDGNISKNLMIEDYDLCTMFSNLLSNAGEACARLQKEEKVIRMQLQQTEHHFVITVSNPVEWRVSVEWLGIHYTSKTDADNHGYGLINVRETVEKYHGHIDFQQKENRFIVHVRLPLARL